jgi:hypothetical protein
MPAGDGGKAVIARSIKILPKSVSTLHDATHTRRTVFLLPVTMRALNESPMGRISDHPPMTVDLPLKEPAQFLSERRR